jgi:hypothetical protein
MRRHGTAGIEAFKDIDEISALRAEILSVLSCCHPKLVPL